MNDQNLITPKKHPGRATLKADTSVASALQEVKSRLGNEFDAKLKYVPKKFRGTFIKSVAGIASKRAAIRAMCQSCVCYENVHEGIGNCQAKTCPLWQYRPYQKK